MINFEREGSKVKVKINTGTGHIITTVYECNSEIYATLLRQQLQDKQYKMTESFARSQYEKGWSDKRQKKNKATWFPSKV